MNIEIVLLWILAGILAEILITSVHTFSTITRHRKIYKEHNQPYNESFFKIFIDTLCETPWWAHIVIFALPPSILLHPSISGK